MPAIASKLIEELFRISERFRDGRFGVQQEVGGRAVRQETGKKGVTGVMEPKTALRCSVLWTALTPRV
jgi:hypothetical protein